VRQCSADVGLSHGDVGRVMQTGFCAVGSHHFGSNGFGSDWLGWYREMEMGSLCVCALWMRALRTRRDFARMRDGVTFVSGRTWLLVVWVYLLENNGVDWGPGIKASGYLHGFALYVRYCLWIGLVALLGRHTLKTHTYAQRKSRKVCALAHGEKNRYEACFKLLHNCVLRKAIPQEVFSSPTTRPTVSFLNRTSQHAQINRAQDTETYQNHSLSVATQNTD